MDATFDVFLTFLPRDINETVIRNLFCSIGKVLKVSIIDDRRNGNCKIGFVAFGSMDEAMDAVRLADKSTAFGDPINASISKKSAESYEPQNQRSPRNNIDYQSTSVTNTPENVSRALFNVGRGRGLQPKRDIQQPSFIPKSIHLTDVKLKSRELLDIEIVDLANLECILVRPLKQTESSKAEIIELLEKVNSPCGYLRPVDSPTVGECYLGRWDDGTFYRAELLEILVGDKFKVAFVDEGTSGDVITEIRHIPEGPLQQVPKQFTKITLGCKNSDELRTFIIEESDGKKVSLFWLGDCHREVPLINLFLGEDEVVEKFILINKVHVRNSFAIKFKDMPNHKVETDCSHVTFIQSMFKSLQDFTVQIREPAVVECHKRAPMILPVPGDICIYEKRSGVNNVLYLRCVVRRRQLFSFDILLFDSGENLNNVSIDCLYASEECHKVMPPFTIICELDPSLSYNEDQFNKIMSDDNLKFSIASYKGNNKYMVSACVVRKEISRYPEVLLKKFAGQSNKVLVTHVVSPVNFFLQVDRVEYVQTLNDIHEHLNYSYDAAHFKNLDAVNVGQAVVAPFAVDGGLGENFRASVIEKRQQSPQVHVYYIDYGNDGWVDYKQLMDVDEDTLKQPALALQCTLNVDIRKEAWNHAIEMFSDVVGFTNNNSIELVMQVLGDCEGKLVVDLISLEKGSVAKALDKSGTCFMKRDDGASVKPVTPVKPTCNGDSKKVHEVQVPLEIARNCVDVSNHVVHGSVATNDDYAFLLQKVNNLEKRLDILERQYSA